MGITITKDKPVKDVISDHKSIRKIEKSFEKKINNKKDLKNKNR